MQIRTHTGQHHLRKHYHCPEMNELPWRKAGVLSLCISCFGPKESQWWFSESWLYPCDHWRVIKSKSDGFPWTEERWNSKRNVWFSSFWKCFVGSECSYMPGDTGIQISLGKKKPKKEKTRWSPTVHNTWRQTEIDVANQCQNILEYYWQEVWGCKLIQEA